jgi:hypothetical protein
VLVCADGERQLGVVECSGPAIFVRTFVHWFLAEIWIFSRGGCRVVLASADGERQLGVVEHLHALPDGFGLLRLVHRLASGFHPGYRNRGHAHRPRRALDARCDQRRLLHHHRRRRAQLLQPRCASPRTFPGWQIVPNARPEHRLCWIRSFPEPACRIPL